MKIFIYLSGKENWLHEKYYAAGGNGRYFTWQVALNLLHQRHINPVIVETGCQRMADDLGAGMSTSIFGEYVTRYGGTCTSVDNNAEHLGRCEVFTRPFNGVSLVQSDSVAYLKDYDGPGIDLLYLDSLDYPIGDDANNVRMQKEAQDHCLNEFKAIEDKLGENTIVLIDDNDFDTGGKPAKLKDYLLSKEWILLLDLQQSLWVKAV